MKNYKNWWESPIHNNNEYSIEEQTTDGGLFSMLHVTFHMRDGFKYVYPMVHCLEENDFLNCHLYKKFIVNGYVRSKIKFENPTIKLTKDGFPGLSHKPKKKRK